MQIVVTAPLGHVGSRVTQLLIQAGVRPTLLTRGASRIRAAIGDHAEVIEGDLGDAEVVLRATDGADALFWLTPRASDPMADPSRWSARLAANVAGAVSTNGVGHVVFLSSIGAELRSGAGEIDGLALTEQQLEATGARVISLRCGYFFTNLLWQLESIREGVVRAPMAPDYAQPWVDPRDVGEVVAARLLNPSWSGQIVQAVHGPEDLTLSKAADIVGLAIGRNVRAETVSGEALRHALREAGFGSRQVEGMAQMTAVMSPDFIAADTRTIITTTPTTLAAWAYDNLRPAISP